MTKIPAESDDGISHPSPLHPRQRGERTGEGGKLHSLVRLSGSPSPQPRLPKVLAQLWNRRAARGFPRLPNAADRADRRIPAPSEARGSGYEDRFARARVEVAEKTRGGKPRGGWLVHVTGVGFFDFTHFQPGAARSGFELHPVLEIEFLDRERPRPSAAFDPARRKARTERGASRQ